jgi:heme exporter protein C
VPLNFVAVRLAEAYTHPRVLSTTGGHMPGEMRLPFVVALIAMGLLFTTLWKLELAAKRAAIELRRLRRQLKPPPGHDRRSAPAQAPAVATVPRRPSPH